MNLSERREKGLTDRGTVQSDTTTVVPPYAIKSANYKAALYVSDDIPMQIHPTKEKWSASVECVIIIIIFNN